MNKITSEECERILAEIKKTFGPPPVLTSEDRAAYYKIMEDLVKCRPPKDIIGLMLIRDTTNDMWEVRRCDRTKSLVYADRILKHLEMQKQRRDLEQKRKLAKEKDAAEVKESKDDKDFTAEEHRLVRLHCILENTVDDIDALLDQDEAELIQSRTMEKNISFFDLLENMRSKAIDRYREGLDLLERHSEETGPIAKGDDIVEAEFVITGADGKPMPPPVPPQTMPPMPVHPMPPTPVRK